VWDGKSWAYIEPAVLMVRLTHELQRLRRDAGRLQGAGRQAAPACDVLAVTAAEVTL
jgi:hypothetical protein